MIKNFIHIFLTFSLALLTACATTTVTTKTITSDFTLFDWQDSQVAIVGISPFPHTSNAELRKAAGEFAGAFKQEFPNLSVAGVNHAKQSIGINKYNQLMNAYGRAGELTPDQFTELQRVLSTTRYWVLMRITQNNVDHSYYSTEDKNKKDWTFSYITKRAVSVELSIYDSTSNKLVYRAVLTNSDSNSFDAELEDASDHDIDLAAVRGANTKSHAYPDPPGIGSIIAQMAPAFASNLRDALRKNL